MSAIFFLATIWPYFYADAAAPKKTPPRIKVTPHPKWKQEFIIPHFRTIVSTIKNPLYRERQPDGDAGAGSADGGPMHEPEIFGSRIAELNSQLLDAFQRKDCSTIREIYNHFETNKCLDDLLSDDLLQAARTGNQKLTETILSIYTLLNLKEIVRGHSHETPFTLAIRSGHTHIAKKILAFNPEYALQRNDYNESALMICAETDNVDIATAMLACIPDDLYTVIIDYQSINGTPQPYFTAQGDSALIIAVNHEHENMVELLLSHKANRFAKNFWGYSAHTITGDPSYPNERIRHLIHYSGEIDDILHPMYRFSEDMEY